MLDWQPHGVLGHFFSAEAAAAIHGCGIPAVDTALDAGVGDLPQVGLDDRAIGVTAAEYLLDRGFTNFMFVGEEHKECSRRTAAAFESRVRRAKHAVTHASSRWFQAPVEALRPPSRAACRWLARLPRPLAAFAAGDHLALSLLEAARAAGLRVPEDVAVLGAGNIELICSMAYPSLSSVKVAAEPAGYEAARVLDHLMSGGRASRISDRVSAARRAHAAFDRRRRGQRPLACRRTPVHSRARVAGHRRRGGGTGGGAVAVVA